MQKIKIINYGMGNIGSVVKKIKKIGFEPFIATAGKDLQNADKIILPGVGHFGTGIGNLKKLELWDALNESVLIRKIPILGICLGMQLFADFSEEGDSQGLGWINGKVIRFRITDTKNFKIPHTGWNTINIKQNSMLFENVPVDSEFYFVHSYHFLSKNENEIISTTNYCYEFTSAVQKDNIFGVQFHPEKSHDSGERLLLNFLNT